MRTRKVSFEVRPLFLTYTTFVSDLVCSFDWIIKACLDYVIYLPSCNSKLNVWGSLSITFFCSILSCAYNLRLTHLMALVGERVTSLLIINPNSSRSITDGLIDALTPLTPLGTKLVFYTAPNTAPSAITDSTTGIQSANSCYNDIITQDLINRHDGFLVCCCKSGVCQSQEPNDCAASSWLTYSQRPTQFPIILSHICCAKRRQNLW